MTPGNSQSCDVDTRYSLESLNALLAFFRLHVYYTLAQIPVLRARFTLTIIK